jgi:hypothetical protein
MKAQAQHLPSPKDSPVSSMSVLVLVSHWPLTERYQKQLKALAQVDVVQELILFGKEVQELPLSLAGELKLRSYQLPSASLPLMTEAAAFEAGAEVLLVLKQGVSLPEWCLMLKSATWPSTGNQTNSKLKLAKAFYINTLAVIFNQPVFLQLV